MESTPALLLFNHNHDHGADLIMGECVAWSEGRRAVCAASEEEEEEVLWGGTHTPPSSVASSLHLSRRCGERTQGCTQSEESAWIVWCCAVI